MALIYSIMRYFVANLILKNVFTLQFNNTL